MLFDNDKESAIIKVIGVGGGGTNAVNHMKTSGIVGVDFAVCNTDQQSLDKSPVDVKIQLGPYLTEGRGAGNKPEVGKEACKESIEEVRQFLEQGTKMLFVTAGMGGGTGTGAAPIIAKAAKELDILTVGIVTVPFTFEGPKRLHQALEGIDELKKNVDALIVISNDRLKEIYGNLKISEAFSMADNILTTAAKGIAEIITIPGIINVDFEDVNTVLRSSGVAIMGSGSASGEDRAREALDKAMHSPLIEDNDIRGAKHILLNITSGEEEITMDEVSEITDTIQEEAGYGTVLIWGTCHDPSLSSELVVTLIASGFEQGFNAKKEQEQTVVDLHDDEDQVTPAPHMHAEPEFEISTGSTELDPVIKSEAPSESKSSAGYSYKAPYVKAEVEERQVEQDRMKKREDETRREMLRRNNMRITDSSALHQIENEPAYKRRNVSLEDVPHSSEAPQMSSWTLGLDDDSPEQRDNSYLHDNVD